jgi:hypothetical protein
MNLINTNATTFFSQVGREQISNFLPSYLQPTYLKAIAAAFIGTGVIRAVLSKGARKTVSSWGVYVFETGLNLSATACIATMLLTKSFSDVPSSIEEVIQQEQLLLDHKNGEKFKQLEFFDKDGNIIPVHKLTIQQHLQQQQHLQKMRQHAPFELASFLDNPVLFLKQRLLRQHRIMVVFGVVALWLWYLNKKESKMMSKTVQRKVQWITMQ